MGVFDLGDVGALTQNKNGLLSKVEEVNVKSEKLVLTAVFMFNMI